jgi:flagellar M-ring protein FliF
MEVLGNMQLGISPQQERWVYLNALQGELVKTINSLEEVAASRVHLVEAERSAFLKRGEDSTASVTVQLHPGKGLSSSQIKGITSLVAGAVRGLKPKQVVLVDESGELLSGPTDGGNDDYSSANNLLEVRQSHENRYKKTILEHLTRIMGSASDVSVAVTVDVVSSSTETQKNTFVPADQVTISETIKESSSKDEQPIGIPGAESNIPEQAPEAEEASSDEKFQSSTNYDYSSVTERTILAPGSPKRVNVSVLINSLALNDLQQSSQGQTDIQSLQQKIVKAVEFAIGKSEKRNDLINVEFVPFTSLTTDKQLISEVIDWEAYMKYALMFLVVVLVFVFIIRPIISTYNQAIVQSQQPDVSSERLEDQDGSNMVLARRLRRMVDNFDTIDAKELNDLVEQHEQPSAEVLRRWLRAS